MLQGAFDHVDAFSRIGVLVLMLGSAPISGAESAPARGRLPLELDDRRPAESVQRMWLQRPLFLGGEIETVADWRVNPALGVDAEDDRVDGEELLALEALLEWSPRLRLFLEAEIFYAHTWFSDNRAQRQHAAGLARKQHWVEWQPTADGRWKLQFGRQNIAEPRAFWWDAELDALRLSVSTQRLHIELLAADELGRVDTDADLPARERDIQRALARVQLKWLPRQRAEGFALVQRDVSSRHVLGDRLTDAALDPQDENLAWAGLRQSGAFTTAAGEAIYWLDLAWVWGTARSVAYEEVADGHAVATATARQRVIGWAYDAGLSLSMPLAGRPTLTLGVARGSGGRAGEVRDRTFRQSGLHSNEVVFAGVDRFHRFGELLRPELSNLSITTLAVGFRVRDDTSVEILHHRYHQHRRQNSLRESGLDIFPAGLARGIGEELDVIVGIEEWKHLELEFGISVFRAGAAFTPADRAVSGLVQMKINYNF